MQAPTQTRCFAMLFAIFLAILPANVYALDEVVTSCANEDDLRAKFDAVQAAGGGTITFGCGQVTITLKNPLTVTAASTIDGGGVVTLSGGGDRRIFVIADGVEATLEGLVLTDGKSTVGGAILNDGDLTLRDVTVQSSEATQHGGAIATTGTLTITDGSVLTRNDAGGGGAISADLGALTTIEDSEVTFNVSTGADGGTGGAVELLNGADLEILRSAVTNNTADRGGAISAAGAGSAVSVEGSNVSDNDTIDGPGGGFLVTAGTLVILDSTLAANDAINGSGGGISVTSATSGAVRRSAIYGNSSTMTGGGISIVNSSGFTIENVTFSQNGALLGGGLDSLESSLAIRHATFASNVGIGGASISNSAANGTLTIENTIVANPASSGNCSDDGTETFVSLGGNLSSDDSCVGLFDQASDAHETDPILSETLADNGGLTPTYLPQPGSPAVDTGVESNVIVDQRGVARPQRQAFDRGAVEIVSCDDVLCGDANRSGSLSASDALLALRTAVGSESCALFRCDFDDDGAVLASDALAILRASVGQPVEPACPEAWDCRDESPLG